MNHDSLRMNDLPSFNNDCFLAGCYTVDDFQMSFPECDALDLLQVLEALHLCTQVRELIFTSFLECLYGSIVLALID